jgi:hypothetical protein
MKEVVVVDEVRLSEKGHFVAATHEWRKALHISVLYNNQKLKISVAAKHLPPRLLPDGGCER